MIQLRASDKTGTLNQRLVGRAWREDRSVSSLIRCAPRDCLARREPAPQADPLPRPFRHRPRPALPGARNRQA